MKNSYVVTQNWEASLEFEDQVIIEAETEDEAKMLAWEISHAKLINQLIVNKYEVVSDINAVVEVFDETIKPKVRMIGIEDGNIFNLIAVAQRELLRVNRRVQADAVQSEIMNNAKSYDEALSILMKYIDIV